MQSSDLGVPVYKDPVEHLEFTTGPLTLDTETAIDLICDAVSGVTVTEPTVGMKIRTQSGMLIAILIEAGDALGLPTRPPQPQTGHASLED